MKLLKFIMLYVIAAAGIVHKTAVGDEIYQWDDGTPEATISMVPEDIYDMWWANRFYVVPNGEFIKTIRIAFYNSGLTVGTPFTVHVYEDPDDDGDPRTGPLQLLATASATVTDPLGGSFQDIAVGPVEVSGGFFVASLLTAPAATSPVALDVSSSAEASWITVADDRTLNPEVPFASPLLDPDLIDNFGIQGNWMIRAIGTAKQPPVPIPTLSEWAQILLALALLGMAGWYWQRRSS